MNTRQFQRAMARARAQANDFARRGLRAVTLAATAASVAMVAGSKAAFKFGADLDHLRGSTSVAVRDLVIMRRALDDNGIAADKLGPAIARMQKSIVDAARGLSEPTDALEQIGLTVDDLTGRSTLEQFRLLAERIGALRDPAVRTASALAIFGRAGAGFLTLFENTGAIDDAIGSLGRMPEILQQSATQFERVDTLLGRLPDKARQFFVGFNAEIVNSILPALEDINKTDFTELGQRLGKALLSPLKAIAAGNIGDFLAATALNLTGKFADVVVTGLSNAAIVGGAALLGALDYAGTSFIHLIYNGIADAAELANKILPQRFEIDAAGLRKSGEMPGAYGSLGEAIAYAITKAPEVNLGKGNPLTQLSQKWLDDLANSFDAQIAAANASAKAMGTDKGGLADAADGASSGLGAFSAAALSFAEKLGFSVKSAAGGERGGGVISFRAREAMRLQKDAERNFDQAARYQAQAGGEANPLRRAALQKEADAARARAQAAQGRVDALNLGITDAQRGVISAGPAAASPLGAGGTSGGAPSSSGSGATSAGDLLQELRALVKAINAVAGKLAVGPSSM